MSEMTKCFYHSSDLDGHCSGAIVKRRYPDCDLIPVNYGDKFPWNDIAPGEEVIMVDFSLQPFDDMLRLAALAALTWIDHHISAIREHEIHGLDATVVLDEARAGCELTWEHLKENRAMPRAVCLLGRYDVWDHSDKDTLPFQYGMRLEDTDPERQAFWSGVFAKFSNKFRDILTNGKVVLRYIERENEKYAKACAFATQLDGLRCIAANRMLANSQTFDSVWDPNVYDAMLIFGWRKDKWTVNLYSDKEDVDVSEVAKRYGGGGHREASGFSVDVLPFELGS